MSDDIRLERRGHVQWITIDREERRNAINDNVLDGIETGIREAMKAAPDVRAIVLTGAGDKAFCAGADLKRTGADRPFQIDHGDPATRLGDLFRLVERCTLPIVGRVNGHAMAGGMGLTAICDMVVAADHARFGMPESRIGIWPMMIQTYVMRFLPRRKLLEMMITGEPIDAAEALQLGFVNYVVPSAELDAKTEWLLDRILRSSPTAIRRGKHIWHGMQDLSLQEAIILAESNAGLMGSSEDAREGIKSFQEKRKPVWTGR
jgi:enoyl-CoA hydratase/carnithine racemase